jgi:hypothetical protein
MSLLRIFWTLIAVLFTVLLIAKFIMAAWIGNPLDVLPSAIGVLLFFYMLFMLEGLQVAGLQVKNLESDAIDHYLERHPIAGRKDVIPVYNTFSENFDGFVVGRQLFTIITVVSIAFLNKSIVLPSGTVKVISNLLGISIPLVQVFADFLNGGLFVFVGSTLIPAWWCQLLSQFMADGRAIQFIALPGSRPVLRTAMLLDQLQLGEPAQKMLNFLSGSGKLGARQQIPIGKESYYTASLNFYGRAKKNHEISLILGNPTTVIETIFFTFQRGSAEHLEHTIQLAHPVVGDIQGKIELPENVYGEIEAFDAQEKGKYIYRIKISFNQSLPREEIETEEVKLEVEYQTHAYTAEAGFSQTMEFSSHLPLKKANIAIQGGEQLLRQPRIRIVEEINGGYAPVSGDENIHNWKIVNPEINNNKAEIVLDHPTVATIYQFEFQTMNVPFALQESAQEYMSDVP